MNAIDVVRNLLALAGAGALVYALWRSVATSQPAQPQAVPPVGDNAPIRVKGGSVTVESDQFTWDSDPDAEDDDDEHQYAGLYKSWEVKAWRSFDAWAADPGKTKFDFQAAGRKVIVEVEQPGNNPKFVFKANGVPRVKCPKGQLVHNGRALVDAAADHVPKKVTVKKRGVVVGEYDLPTRTSVIEMTPVR